MKIKTKIAALVLVLAFALQIPSHAATSFKDIPAGAWYREQVDLLVQLDIINGYSDGTFRPDDQVKRGEFLKMATTAGELYTATQPKGIHWAESYWQMAYEAEILVSNEQTGALLFQCTGDELNKAITRNEAALIVSNVMTKAYFEPRAKITNAANGIKDYASISNTYKDAVEQAYGKGVITGFEDTSFRGAEQLTRAQASVIIVRLLWESKRQPASFAEKVEELPVDTNYTSFALRYRGMTVEERRIALFGDANKTYFASAAEAAPYMTQVTVPTWRINSSGVKVSASEVLTVHKLVAEEVKLIFNEIYNDPEKFPVKAGNIGGARFTDNMRHSWGCAIDMNPNENYYCRTVDGSTTALSGSYWRPGSDPYSITAGGSVVRAFAKYGWGWGGQGWSGGYYDYMHFSILPTGG